MLCVAATVGARQPVLSFEASAAAWGNQRCAVRSKADRLLDGGWTALTLAVELGDDEAMMESIIEGANVDVPDESGTTALTRACHHGHQSLVLALHAKGD
uniref:Uncharacterized protein n=1 Tax=Haptolina brevifila TaxID=156173 RepID=A0A7S2C0J8_9EUKA|mmetsp:Transcript_18932/g.38578  ORF Transcript_18932/g.38578 Transcript_18932/m.38578 type:complete len:100 (+) Transcript_18932:80-379(+)